MKNIILFIAINLILLSCKIDQIQDSKLDAFGPYTENYTKTIEHFKRNEMQIYEKCYKIGGNNLIFETTAGGNIFLLGLSHDFEHKVAKIVFEQNLKGFSVLIKGSKSSLNWKSGNRLAVFKLIDNKPIEILDTAQEEYIDIYFEKDEFVYVPKNGVTKRLKIN